MGVMSPGKLLMNMALPIIASMLVQALYNIVDSIYISRISESAVTALSLAFPVQNMQIGFSTGIAVGVNSLLSRSLGEKRYDRVNKSAGNGIFLVCIITMVFMLFGLFGARPYYEMQSNVQETVEGGIAYTTICCVFTIGLFVEVLGERLLQASGRTIFTMITQGTGAIVNIILDPIFIFGYFGVPAMGIAGAAVATVIGQWIAAILTIIFNLKYNKDVQFALKWLRPDRAIIAPILTVGIPSTIMMAIGSIMNFSMNQILQDFSETATGVFGIYYKVQSFFFMPVIGLNNASISIIAYNYGYGKPKRITKTVRIACGIAFGVMMMGCFAFEFIPHVLLSIFKPSEEFLHMGIIALRIIALHFPLAAFCIVLGSVFQALGNGIYSTITSICRQMVVLLPAAYLLSLTGNVNNVWWAFPIAEVMSLTVTLIFFVKIYREKIRPLYGTEVA